jgi:hypothetical protein
MGAHFSPPVLPGRDVLIGNRLRQEPEREKPVTISIETRGRRHYLVGNTYPIKDAIRSAGCKWDAEARAWYSGKREIVEALVGKVSSGAVQPKASYSKLADGSWGIRVVGTPAPGSTVTVTTKAGQDKAETVVAVLSTTDGVSLCSVAPRAKAARSPSRGYGIRSGGRRTGCACGSIDGQPRDSDCRQCQYDNE